MTPDSDKDSTTSWPSLPTETEIYILPDGQIVIADLPAELAEPLAHLAALSGTTPAEAESASRNDSGRSLDPSVH